MEESYLVSSMMTLNKFVSVNSQTQTDHLGEVDSRNNTK